MSSEKAEKEKRGDFAGEIATSVLIAFLNQRYFRFLNGISSSGVVQT